MVWQQVGSEESWGVLQTLGFIGDYFASLWDALMWNFAFIDGGWIYIKWIIWAPLMAMAIWGFVITFISILQRTLS